jgi:hypothetical protein
VVYPSGGDYRQPPAPLVPPLGELPVHSPLGEEAVERVVKPEVSANVYSIKRRGYRMGL